MKNQADALTVLDIYIRSRFPIIAITSHEENRVLSSILHVASGMGSERVRHVVTWSITQGLKVEKPEGEPETWTPAFSPDADSTRDPIPALEYMLNYPTDPKKKGVLFVMKDIHGLLGNGDRFDPILTRYLRDVAARFELSKHNLILLSPTFQVPPDLEKTVVVLDWPLPDFEELMTILNRCAADLRSDKPKHLNGNREKIVNALRGLTEMEAGSVLLSSIAAAGELSSKCIPFIVKEKAQIIRRDNVLEYFDETVTMNDVGGLEYIKEYALEAREAFTDTARKAGLDIPKGVLLAGVPGTGKSLSAKAMAGGEMPLLRLDFGTIMGSRVGESEDRIRRALKLAGAVAPCVLWADEVEKGISGVNSSAETDGGTMARVFGTILTWMQENKQSVYLVATANDASILKPEFLRRFDDVIFVDLPCREDRIEILKVHLNKRGLTPEQFDLETLAELLWGFSGAEIEKVVSSAVRKAFFRKVALTDGILIEQSRTMVPISVTSKSKIEAIRTWAADANARTAGRPMEDKPREAAGSRDLSEI